MQHSNMLMYIFIRFHIPIRNSDEEDGTVIYFPVPNDKVLTLEDLRE